MTQGADERSGPPPPDPQQDARRDEVERLLRGVGAYQLQGYRNLTREDISIKEDTGHGRAVVTEYDVETEKRVLRFGRAALSEGQLPGRRERQREEGSGPLLDPRSDRWHDEFHTGHAVLGSVAGIFR